MEFLRGHALGMALQLWRAAKSWKQVDVVANSNKMGGKRLHASNVSELENAGEGFSYDHLVKNIFPSYGIRDICDYDLFLDYCVSHSIDTVAVVKAGQRDVRNLPDSREVLIPPSLLGTNRTRISLIEIRPHGKTEWQRHEGHEYVMVNKGEVEAQFAERENCEESKRRIELLATGDGVAFNSAIFHTFINKSSDPAELIVARPSKSLPKGMQGI